MSRVDKNGITQYTIGEKIAYYQAQLQRRNLSKRKETDIRHKLQSLQNMKRKYGVVYMEDDRFFKRQTGDGHHYIISDIDSNDNVSTHRITHHAKGNEPLTGFDGRSYMQKQHITHDRRNRRLNANEAYSSSYSNSTLNHQDISLIDRFRKRK